MGKSLFVGMLGWHIVIEFRQSTKKEDFVRQRPSCIQRAIRKFGKNHIRLILGKPDMSGRGE